MFELKIGKSQETEEVDGGKCSFSVLRKIVEGVGDIVKSADIRVSADGLYLQAMDPMHVSMVDIFIKNTAFESFRCDREILLGVPMPLMNKLFKSLPVTANSSILLSADDEATELNIICEENSKKYKYSLKLLSNNAEEYFFPQIDYDVSLSMSPLEIQNTIKTLGVFGEILKVSSSYKGILFLQESEAGNTEIFYGAEEQEENHPNGTFNLSVTKECSVSFPYKYLALFGKFSPLGTSTSIHMKDQQPIHIGVDMCIGHLRYYIAPRDDE
ncbi:proliferating cell nuclear antigen [Nematocida sp. LUAm3]|nr:proliferating cell nuclear antigen [Nematocida sp. LUAm3]KAI5176260.1 proliferating cell nuclear antigen [Nematocida sp. LUAm2]KAI5176718.1 proliferating cell nuclear antigen [Nematocida sp. LUAm1]